MIDTASMNGESFLDDSIDTTLIDRADALWEPEVQKFLSAEEDFQWQRVRQKGERFRKRYIATMDDEILGRYGETA